MNIEVNQDFKFASVWLTNEEKEDEQLREDLVPIINAFKEKKYKFVIFESGSQNLLDLTAALLSHNKNLVVNN